MSGSEGSSGHSAGGEAQPPPSAAADREKKKGKARVSRTSLILWHAHQNDTAAVRKLLEEDRSLVHARDYDDRTPLHVAAIHGWIDVAKCLLEYEADVNAQDRWKNTVNSITILSSQNTLICVLVLSYVQVVVIFVYGFLFVIN